MRQPYGRKIASTVVYAHPTWYAAHGFIVVIQDVRGRGTSGGEFQLFEHEVEDGCDTVNWAAGLPQSNGQVGMYGFSYQGMTQLFAAEAGPPALKALAPAMVGYHPDTDWAYEQGALLLQAGVEWAIQLAAETARLKGDRAAFQALYQASRNLPIYEGTPAWPTVLQHHAPDSFFFDWLTHPPGDDYWQPLTPQLGQVDLPMLHIGGWFDPYLRGDVRLYQEMVARSQYPQPFWIGPWGHIPWSRRGGARDFGPVANSPIDRLQINWFSHWLQGTGEPQDMPTAVTLFEMGRNQWREFGRWPQGQSQRWYPTSRGLAAMRQDDGALVPQLATAAAPSLEETGLTIDTIVHDPWRPVPSLGGHAALPSGVFDRASLDSRSDVITYTSAPLATAIAVAGHIDITLNCRCDRPTFDLSVTLSEVLPTGVVYNLTQGYGRFQHPPNTWQDCQLMLQPTCFEVPAGHALRLSISAASFPAYTVNSGTHVCDHERHVMTSNITTIELRASHQGTYIRLPRQDISSSQPSQNRTNASSGQRL
jgi:putative CocE/NonD family hydrolase